MFDVVERGGELRDGRFGSLGWLAVAVAGAHGKGAISVHRQDAQGGKAGIVWSRVAVPEAQDAGLLGLDAE